MTTVWLRSLRAVALILIATFLLKEGRTLLLEWFGISVSPTVYAIGSVLVVYVVLVLSMKSVRKALKQLDVADRSQIRPSPDHLPASALIVISRGSTFADRRRDYRVLLDGDEIGRLADGDTKSFPTTPGTHSLKLKIDWAGSNEISFDANTAQTVTFECISSLRGWRVAFAVFALFWPSSYIRLERV